jgi:serine protease Do
MNRSVAFIVVAIVAGFVFRPLVAQDVPQPAPLSLSAGTLLAPKAFRAAAAKVQPSLVRIEGFGGIAAGADGGGYQAPGEGPTTGLILSSDGHIVTSTFNFLRKPPIITVVMPDGRRRVAQLLGRDETRKICLLKVEGVSNLAVPQFAPRGELKVGQWAVAIGIGFGALEPAISAGIISATSRISGKAVQTDANTSPANYGGPLVNLEGRVIGICVPLSPGSTQEAAGAEWYDSGIGFAIPLDGLESILDRLKAGETLKHPFLGVHTEPYGDPPSGAQIKEVVADSPAAKAGLAAGDKLLSLGGADITDVTHLRTVINRYFAGDKVEVIVQRGEERKTFTAELAVPPPPVAPMPMPVPMPGSEKPNEKDRQPGQPMPGRPQPAPQQPRRPPM